MAWYCSEYYKVNLQKTYLAYTFLFWAMPSGAVTLFSSARSSSLPLRHVPPAHLILSTFTLQGKQDSTSATITLPHVNVPFASTPFCTAGAHLPLHFDEQATKDVGVYCLCTRWLALLQALKYSVWGAGPLAGWLWASSASAPALMGNAKSLGKLSYSCMY